MLRIENLKLLIVKYDNNQAKLSVALDETPGYISQLKLGTRPINEKTARKIEKKLSLPADWMDHEHTRVSKGRSMNLGGRIKAERKAKGWTQQQFADRTTAEQQAIQATEARDSKKSDHVQSIADALGISVSWLLTGEGLKHPSTGSGQQPNIVDAEEIIFGDTKSGLSIANTAPGPDISGLIPVISWVHAGDWHEAIDEMRPHVSEEMIACVPHHGAQTYALRIQGDSMTSPVGRSYPDGCIIYVDPDQRGCASTGDRIIAKVSGENMVTFKQLANDGTKPYLKPLNPQHQPIFEEFRVLGKVIGMYVSE